MRQLLVGLDGGAGQTALEMLRRQLARARDEHRIHSAIWLAPTFRQQRNVLARIAQTETGTVTSAGVFTFATLADRILAQSRQTARLTGPAAQRLLLKRLLANGVQTGAIEHYRDIAHTKGFRDLVAGLIAELKRDEAWPDDFQRALASRNPSSTISPADRELLWIYENYQAALNQHNWFDPEGRLWLARTALLNGELLDYVQLDLLIVDGFADFTRPQFEMVTYLSQHARSVVVTLPLPDDWQSLDSARKAVFHKPIATLAKLQQVFGELNVTPATRSATEVTTATACTTLRTKLFANPRTLRPTPPQTGLRIVSAVGDDNELAEMARQVKLWLANGVRPHEIVVATRSLEQAAPRILAMLHQAGVPARSESSPSLATSAVGQIATRFLQIVATGWTYPLLQSIFDHSLFAPNWPEWQSGESARIVLETLREAQLFEDRQQILGELERRKTLLENDTRTQTDAPRQRRLASMHLTHQVLNRLAESLRPLEATQTFTAAVTGLDRAVKSLCREVSHRGSLRTLPPTQSVQPRHTPHSAWQLIESRLRSAATVNFGSDPRITAAEFTAEFLELIGEEEFPPLREDDEAVLVLSADEAQHCQTRHLVVLGLAEGSFPPRRRENCLYGDDDRRQLNEAGLTLAEPKQKQQDEMLLFQRLVASASHEVVLSYASFDEKGQEVFASPYLKTVVSLFAAGEAMIETVGSLAPVSKLDRATQMAEIRLAGVQEAIEGNAGPLVAIARDMRWVGWAPTFAAAARCLQARFHTPGWTRYEGVVENPAHRNSLQQHFSENYQFSATKLEDFANCGLRFWLKSVLKLRPLELEQVETDHRGRGNVLHSALANAVPQLLAGEATTAALARLEELLAVEVERTTTPTQFGRALSRTETLLMQQYAAAFLPQHAQYLESLNERAKEEPRLLGAEIAFGQIPDQPLAHSALPGVVFGLGKDTVTICGKIDRVDSLVADGVTHYQVIDYKTGSVTSKRFTLDGVRNGAALQLVVYMVCVRRLNLVPETAVADPVLYWELSGQGPVAGFKKSRKGEGDDATTERLELELDRLLPILAAEIREGLFRVNSQDKTCTRYCEYSHACRINQLRPVAVRLGKVRE